MKVREMKSMGEGARRREGLGWVVELEPYSSSGRDET